MGPWLGGSHRASIACGPLQAAADASWGRGVASAPACRLPIFTLTCRNYTGRLLAGILAGRQPLGQRCLQAPRRDHGRLGDVSPCRLTASYPTNALQYCMIA